MNPVAAAAAPAERRELVAMAGELARRELAPRARQLDEQQPEALGAAWARLVEVGFDRALVAVDCGGAGLDAATLLGCLEEIAVGDAGVALSVLLSNAALAALPAERVAALPTGARWAMLPAPPAELPTAARIEVEQRDGPATVRGELCPALGALGADGLVLVADGKRPAVLGLPATTAGMRTSPAEPQLGLRAAPAARVSFTGPAAQVAIAEPDALLVAARSLALLRAGTAAIARGLSRRALAAALDYAENRIQGGVPIVAHDAVRDMLAAMRVRLAAGKSPATALEAGEAETLAAKIAATEAAVATTTDAVQVFGGAGYMHESGVEKLMRDAKCLQLWPEPNWIAARMLAAGLSPGMPGGRGVAARPLSS
ncbi:MAG: acyl-CoA dehydrogenase family protein [Nitrososphaerota archaeon]